VRRASNPWSLEGIKSILQDRNAFIGFRVYVNKKTKVASALYDIIWSHGILFTKRNNLYIGTCLMWVSFCLIKIRVKEIFTFKALTSMF